MHIPKVYGQSKASGCLFCGKQSIRMNEQGIPVCITHKEAVLNDFKCACGRWLDLREGKWGPYWLCQDCGIVPMRKAIEFNTVKDVSGVGTSRATETRTEATPAFKTQTPSISTSQRSKKPAVKNMLGHLPPDYFK